MKWNTNGGRTIRIASAGHAAFAATMITFGILGLIKRDFTALWQPVPKSVPAREVMIYLCALIPLACGIGLLWQRVAAAAARVLLAYLLLWLLVLRVPLIFISPIVGVWWASCQTAVMTAAAWVLYDWFAADWDRRCLELRHRRNHRLDRGRVWVPANGAIWIADAHRDDGKRFVVERKKS